MVPESTRTSLGKRVHIIPLGHEIDRAVAPFHGFKPDLVYLLSVPPNQDLDPKMMQKQLQFTSQVYKKITKLGIECKSIGVNLFDTFATMRNLSWLIREQKEAGNIVEVNMSACGRKTSVAVTLVGMIQNITVYYVSADRYSSNPKEESEHGLSIVNPDHVVVEPFVNFSFTDPGEMSQRLLAQIYLKDEIGGRMKSDDIIRFLQKQGLEDYKITQFDLPEKTREYSCKQREILNKINRQYIGKLVAEQYIEKIKISNYFAVQLRDKGKYMACASGFLSPTFQQDFNSDKKI